MGKRTIQLTFDSRIDQSIIASICPAFAQAIAPGHQNVIKPEQGLCFIYDVDEETMPTQKVLGIINDCPVASAKYAHREGGICPTETFSVFDPDMFHSPG